MTWNKSLFLSRFEWVEQSSKWAYWVYLEVNWGFKVKVRQIVPGEDAIVRTKCGWDKMSPNHRHDIMISIIWGFRPYKPYISQATPTYYPKLKNKDKDSQKHLICGKGTKYRIVDLVQLWYSLCLIKLYAHCSSWKVNAYLHIFWKVGTTDKEDPLQLQIGTLLYRQVFSIKRQMNNNYKCFLKFLKFSPRRKMNNN